MREGADGDSNSARAVQVENTERRRWLSRRCNKNTEELKRVELAILPSPSREEEDHALRRDHDGDRPRQCQQA